MIIPIRCFTCGKVLANKWKTYKEKVEKQEPDENEQQYKMLEANHKAKILQEIGITKMCCKRHMLTHIDIVDSL